MLRISAQKREVEALEKIARASVRLANATGRMAAFEQEKTGWLKWFFGLFGYSNRRSANTPPRRYRGDGGLRSGVEIPPLLPRDPRGHGALPEVSRPCINVTPTHANKTRRESSW